MSVEGSKNVMSGGSSIDAKGNVNIGDEVVIHNYGDFQARRVLGLTLPFIPKAFIGREEELRELHAKLFSGETLLFLVNGVGGVGKTTLAARYYQRYQDKYAHVAWVLSEKSIANALLGLAYSLGIPQFDEKTPVEERVQLVITRMASLNKPCLLIIDNANELDDLKAHFKILSSCTNFHILLTTRVTDYKPASFFRVKGLPESEAMQLFKYHYQDHRSSEDQLLREMIAAVEHNTLVIELFAKNLQQLNELEPEYDLHELLQDIEQSMVGIRKTELITTPYQAKGTGLRDATPEAIISAMYDVRELSEAEKKLISVFAVLPNERIAYQMLKELLPDEEIKRTVLALAQKGWIEYNRADKSFKANQVVQDVVKVKHRNRLLEDCGQLIKTLTEALADEHLLHIDKYEEALFLIRYADSVMATLNRVDDDLATLCQNIGIFYSDTGDLIRAMTAYQKMEALQLGLLSEDPENPNFKNGLAISYSKLGWFYRDKKRLPDQARVFFQRCYELWQELARAYPAYVEFTRNYEWAKQALNEE